MLKKIITFFIVLVLIFSCLGAGAYLYIQSWADKSGPFAKTIEIRLERNQSLNSFAQRLYHFKVIDNPRLFKLFARSHYPKFQAGLYQFDKPISPRTIAQKIISGDIYVPIAYQITIPEGFTVEKTARRLVAGNIGRYPHIIQLTRNREFLKELNLSKVKSLEGFLYPSTYIFHEMPTAKQVLTKMVQTFWERLPANYEEDVKKMGLTLIQAVTFASMIELETSVDEERPMVSEVIWNRLKKGMALAIDATIIYGIKDYDGNIRTRHLQDSSNPYNTRIHRGLPPTPIGSPSYDSLVAVLNPTNFGYYYYVLESFGKPNHLFSKTLNEHNNKVSAYLKTIKK